MSSAARRIGEVLLKVENISLSFGGIRALDGVGFEIRKGEILAIIGPNGAGKSSMLNVINGFYRPQEGTIVYKGTTYRGGMRTYEAAASGIARTFQNIALFKSMSTLDNIMTGRLIKMRSGLLAQALYWGPELSQEIAHRRVVEKIIDFPGDRGDPQGAGGQAPLRPAEAGRTRACVGGRAGSAAAG